MWVCILKIRQIRLWNLYKQDYVNYYELKQTILFLLCSYLHSVFSGKTKGYISQNLNVFNYNIEFIPKFFLKLLSHW